MRSYRAVIKDDNPQNVGKNRLVFVELTVPNKVLLMNRDFKGTKRTNFNPER